MQILTARETRMVACVLMAALAGLAVKAWRDGRAVAPLLEEAATR